MQTTVRGFTFEVEIDAAGVFSTELDGDRFQADRLDTLRRQLDEALKAKRGEFEFVTVEGDRGVARGFHAGERAVLVTLRGQKTKVSTGTKVFAAGELSEVEIEELVGLQQQIQSLIDRRSELYRRGVDIGDLLNDALGENLTGSYSYEAKLKKRAEEGAMA